MRYINLFGVVINISEKKKISDKESDFCAAINRKLYFNLMN